MGKKPCINCGIWVSWGDRNGCRNCGKIICRECLISLERLGKDDKDIYCPVCCVMVASIDIKKLQSKIKESKSLLNRGLEFITCSDCNEKQRRWAGNYCAKCGYKLSETKGNKSETKGNKR